MLVEAKLNCPHVKNDNLLPIEDFKKIKFAELKCENCEEKKELWICLFCGKTFCSRYVNSHFIQHNKENPEHCLGLGVHSLGLWCCECIISENDNKEQNKEDEKGCYIKSEKTDEYIKILYYYKFKREDKDEKSEEEENKGKENITYNENYQKEILERKNDLCEHIKAITKEEFENSPIIKGLKDIYKIKKDVIFDLLCFSCDDKIKTYEELKSHTTKNHNIYIDMNELMIVCMECKRKFNLTSIKDKLTIEQKTYIQSIIERFPICPKFLTPEEIYEIKYNRLVKDFSSGKYKNIIFMVGAGISTSAGIPDFRSDTGLFKQLQEKYNLSGPEEFFVLDTFLQNPMFFYEFTKLFDLSQTKPTIAHKFMNFLTQKNCVKYVFTQNIDGLEIKAKIPKEKLIFAHGNFIEGHCPKCKEDVDIEKINEGINKGEIYYCPKCKGPCKPKIVFYGESLPVNFFKCMYDIQDVDLIIIMGTSLKVYPFASIPEFADPNVGIVVFNMEKVGVYQYGKIDKNDWFIQGKTDENILKFLKDVKLYDEFEKFITDEYGEELNDIIGKEKKLMNVKDLEEEKKKVDELGKKMDDLKLEEKKKGPNEEEKIEGLGLEENEEITDEVEKIEDSSDDDRNL